MLSVSLNTIFPSFDCWICVRILSSSLTAFSSIQAQQVTSSVPSGIWACSLCSFVSAVMTGTKRNICYLLAFPSLIVVDNDMGRQERNMPKSNCSAQKGSETRQQRAIPRHQLTPHGGGRHDVSRHTHTLRWYPFMAGNKLLLLCILFLGKVSRT